MFASELSRCEITSSANHRLLFELRNRSRGSLLMAQKVQVLLVDDLDGGTAEETVSFSLDGRAYEIDLNKKNAAKLRKTFAPYKESARKARPAGGRRAAARAAGNCERSPEIRGWGRPAGSKVNERGRMPATVIDQYEAAH